MSFWDFLKNIFSKKEEKKETPIIISEPIQKKPEEIKEEIKKEPEEKPKEESKPVEIDWLKWTSDAAFLSSTFEGKGGDYANVTGNFDGAFLTCGLLGLTWKYNNQVKIIDEYLIKYGPNKLLKLMPQTGQRYLEAVNAGERAGSYIVSDWSNGAKVYEPYKSELTAFWSSPEMIEMQNKTYEKMMGVFSKKKCLETAKYFKSDAPKYYQYAYWFDQAVLNGAGISIDFDVAKRIDVDEVLDWVKNLSGYNKSSNKLNYGLWSKQIKKADNEQIHLFKMAYLRSLKSRSEFQGTTMMRRGTVALGIGVVNEKKRTYDWCKS